jgi:hypothetical protein
VKGPGLKARLYLEVTITADPYGMTTEGQATTKTKTKAGGMKFYVPPFAKSAKDGAPNRLWLGEENKQKQRQVHFFQNL